MDVKIRLEIARKHPEQCDKNEYERRLAVENQQKN